MSGDDIIDAEWEEVPDGDASRAPARNSLRRTAHSHRSAPPPTDAGQMQSRLDGLWREKVVPLFMAAGQIAVIVLGGTFLIMLASKWFELRDQPVPAPIVENETVPHEARQNAQPEQQQDAKQMLMSWTKAVTGRDDASGFAMIDGTGNPGDFCNDSNGNTLLRFGGSPAGDVANIVIYDFFAEYHGTSNSGVLGAFWYDTTDGSLLTRNQAAIVGDGNKGETLPDIVHTFHADGSGRAMIDGTAYHVCTL